MERQAGSNALSRAGSCVFTVSRLTVLFYAQDLRGKAVGTSPIYMDRLRKVGPGTSRTLPHCALQARAVGGFCRLHAMLCPVARSTCCLEATRMAVCACSTASNPPRTPSIKARTTWCGGEACQLAGLTAERNQQRPCLVAARVLSPSTPHPRSPALGTAAPLPAS